MFLKIHHKNWSSFSFGMMTVFSFGALSLGALKAQAHCGLEFCPITHGGAAGGGLGLETDLSLKHAAFDIGGEGSYDEAQLHLLYRLAPGWTFAAHISGVSLDAPGSDGRKIGMANPLVSVEKKIFLSGQLALSGGIQLEMPFGDQDDGMAADHWMGVPYVTFSNQSGSLFYGAQLGLSSVLPPWGGDAKPDSGAAAADPVLYVGPHEDHEMLYRFTVGEMEVWKRVSPEAYLSGRYVLEPNAENVHFITAGMDVAIGVGQGFLIKPNAEIPLTHPHRMDWNAGLDFGYVF